MPPASTGGPGPIVWQLGLGMIEAGHQVTFVSTTREAARVEDRQGVPLHLLHSDYWPHFHAWFGLMNPQTVVPLNRLLRELAPDIVHAHHVHDHLGYHCLVVGRFANAATVFTAHDVMPFAYEPLTRYIDPAQRDHCGEVDPADYKLPFGYNWRKMGLLWNPARGMSIRHTMHYYADARVAISRELQKALAANGLQDFEVVYNGIDPAFFDVPAASIEVLRQRFNLVGRQVILFGGQLNRNKGDQQLLSALRRVKERVPNVALLVLSPSTVYLDQLIRDHSDLAQHIVRGGWLTGAELATAYRLADVVATPSIYFDPFSTVNLEGMAAGSPPVTTCFGGAPEAVLDGETGYVVNPYNTGALADRLIRLLTDEPLRQRLAAAGQQRVQALFSLRRQVDQMLTIYETAYERRQKKGHAN